MPIYEYQCANCGHQFEALQKVTEAPLKDCPACHSASLSKLVSAAGFQLKGSGWYLTDYSNKGKPKAEGDSKTASTDSAKGGESSSGTSSNTSGSKSSGDH